MYCQSSLAQAVFQPCNGEPTLDDMLADPIVKLLMSSDGVRSNDLERLLNAAKQSAFR